MEEQKNIPSLRFPEFSKEWNSKELEKVFSIFNCYAFSSSDATDNGTLWVKIADVGILEMKKDNLSYLPAVYVQQHKKFLLKKGDYVVALTRPILNGKLKIARIDDFFNDSLLNQRVGKIITSDNPTFVYAILQKDELIKSIENNIAGSDPPNLSPSEINYITVFIPTLPEQTKIANFLAAVDERLNQLKQKKTLLEQYKKGVMQKIFDQEIRFKDEDGREYPVWEMKKLDEIGETYNGLSGKTKDDFGQGKPYIQYKQIFDNSKIDVSRFEYVNIGETEKQNRVFFGDIFFTVSSETPDEIGTTSVLLDKIDELYLNSFCFGYRPNSLEEFSPYFAQCLFRSDLFRTKIVKLAQGSTRYNMSKVQLMKLQINLPCIQEQTKIANFLSAIDEKISLCDTQIAKTEQYKKGLLQQMFV